MQYLNSLYTDIGDLKIDLGSGISPREGYVGIDNYVGIKAQTIDPQKAKTKTNNVIQWDLSRGIPFDDNSISEVSTSHFLEHFPDLDLVFEETFRLLKEGGRFEITIPYANSAEGMYPGHVIFLLKSGSKEISYLINILL